MSDITSAPRVVFGTPRPMTRYAHVLRSGSCSVDGHSTWGYRVECLGCGAVEAPTAGSSVSAEDGPRYFAYAHRECPGAHVEVDEFGRY